MKPFRKINLLPLVALSLLLSNSIYGQVTAGSVPPGTNVHFTPVEMSIIENDHDTTTNLDLDGDGMDDVRIWLIKGNPPSDAPNMVVFFALGNTFSFCNLTEPPEHVAFYQLGDTLCWNDGTWGIDSVYTVGCYLGWNCTQDESPVIDKFVAYKKNETNEIGWLKVSMSLFSNVDQIPVTFTISEMLVLYLGSSLNDPETVNFFELYPNPTLSGKFVIKSDRKISKFEVYNSEGQLISIHKYNDSNYSLSELSGVYFIRAMDIKGHYSTQKIVRL